MHVILLINYCGTAWNCNFGGNTLDVIKNVRSILLCFKHIVVLMFLLKDLVINLNYIENRFLLFVA